MVAGIVAFTAHLLEKEAAVYDVSCHGNKLITKCGYLVLIQTPLGPK